jgi:hypothetical protein
MLDMNADNSEVDPEDEDVEREVPNAPDPDRARAQDPRTKPAPGRLPARASRI